MTLSVDLFWSVQSPYSWLSIDRIMKMSQDYELEVNGKYSPPTGNKYVASKYFYFKHGVYSKNIFDYVLESKISVNKVN